SSTTSCTSGSATSGGAAASQLGRRPRLVSPYSVNWLTTSTACVVSATERFITPCSSSMMRRFQIRSASLAARSGESSWVTPTSTHRPAPMSATGVRPRSTVTRARLTRCTSARMKGGPYRAVGWSVMRADPDRPLRIAYLSYRGKPHVGGQGVYTRHLTKALVDLGHRVEVLGGQPYPVLDERVTLTKLPSLDIFNDHYPGRFPAYWELKHWED